MSGFRIGNNKNPAENDQRAMQYCWERNGSGQMRSKQSGFTLIELIVVLVLVAIVAAAMAPFIGSALTRSHEPIDNLGHATALSSQMAKIVSAYDDRSSCEELANWDIENDVPGFDPAHVTLLQQRLCYFAEEDDENFILVCSDEVDFDDDEEDPEVLQVRLEGSANPGESLTYYFYCEP